MLKQNPTRIYLVIGGGRALFNALVFTINLIYQVQTVGLNPLQMVLVGTVLEVTVLLFEVPTGAVADVYTRRLSVLIGLTLVGCGFLLEGSIPLFWAVLGAQVLWGIGYTFLSGALQAWLADEIGADAAGPVYLRSAQVELIAGLAGTGVSVWLARRWLQLPILVGGVMYIALAAFMALIMPERGFQPTPPEERETWKEMAATARAGMRAVRDHPALRIVVGLSLVTGLYSEGYDRLWTPHMLDSFSFPSLFGLEDALIWFGIIGVGATMTGIAANELARRGRATEVRARTVNWLTLALRAVGSESASPGLDAQFLDCGAGALGDQSLPQHDGAVGERVDRTQHAKRAAGNSHLAVGTGELFRPGGGRASARLDWDGRSHPGGVDSLLRGAVTSTVAAGAGEERSNAE